MKSRRIEFEPPAGVVPEGTKAGDTFDVVTTFRVTKSGQVCVVQVGETKMPGYNDKGETEEDNAKDKPTKQFKDLAGELVGSMKEAGVQSVENGDVYRGSQN